MNQPAVELKDLLLSTNNHYRGPAHTQKSHSPGSLVSTHSLTEVDIHLHETCILLKILHGYGFTKTTHDLVLCRFVGKKLSQGPSEAQDEGRASDGP